MLPKLFSKIDAECEVKITKYIGDEDVSCLGAFCYGEKIRFELSVPRRLGCAGVVIRIARDGESYQDIALTRQSSDVMNDVYTYSLDTSWLAGEYECGLFYYEFLFLRGLNTLFTDSINNVDFKLSDKNGKRFRLTVYKKSFQTPHSFGQGVMYQIFTDRFFRGESDKARSLPVREGAEFDPDWENGIPEYAAYPGASLKNNRFFGGNLWGVAEKLDYLKSLGVTYIYLCPIFKAYSNHKYDTADYTAVDEMFGGDEAFDNLVKEAREKDIGIILDGVFNHTGDDSVYFNKYKHYGDGGAYNDPLSEYAGWFRFRSHPNDYESWWGIEILPKLNHKNESCRHFFTGEGGIIEKYIKRGIAGWRLDVADELSNEFLDELRETAKKSSNGEAVIIGEVWENAADKVAYGERRRYFLGDQLDSVMNYPLKNAIVSFCSYGDAEILYDTLIDIYSSYPRCVSDKLMNLLGTHDTERILTVLGRESENAWLSNDELARLRLSDSERKAGIELLKIASVLQYTAYGIPSLYYGDEIGVEGYGDPFCRMPFPWHDIDNPYRAELLEHYRKLGEIRTQEQAFNGGTFHMLGYTNRTVAYSRERGDSKIIVIANRGEEITYIAPSGVRYMDLINGKVFEGGISVQPNCAMILKEMKAVE